MALKTVRTATLDIAYLETGPADGIPAILLHGFPYDAHAYDAVTETLSASGYRCIVPWLRGYGPTRFLSATTPRSGEQAALGADLLALMDALSINRAVLGGYDWGGRAACIVAALQPGRAIALVSCGTGYNIQNIPQAGRPVAPEEEARYWYQYYFHSERGRAALTENRRDLCRFIWKSWSPLWTFDDATFAASAAAFDNPDFVEVVVHSYRHRFGLVAGDPAFAAIETALEKQPSIGVPTVVLQGIDDGVDPPAEADEDAAHFTGPYERRRLAGIGHNLPQEAPEDFARAVLSLASFA
ncbi:alpha/beta hydrolase [Rhizobiaceae bacterium BDR2-2]|uniref:Alpha/beta hydrolase n=1 Tax=Ectorhizobium quercum TaxID=2965071 RepID=A0AAE3SX98_9HYPH|nr:alpha/beta hydrolase [Ectorhizobium quercum]MCX8998260.1 alpha/beta hydrolase [Ectorhizobium quercum]